MRTTYQKHLGSECISYRSLHTGTGHIWITGSSAISKSKGVCVHSGGGAGVEPGPRPGETHTTELRLQPKEMFLIWSFLRQSVM